MEPATEDPLAIFDETKRRAAAKEPLDATVAALATVSADGLPALRYVLVKQYGPDGFAFYTNYESAKAKDLDATGRAALAWHWPSIGVQVRVTGTTARVSAERSDAYFQSRPRGSQIGAIASEQSRPLTSRAELEQRHAELERAFERKTIPRPSHWGGYLLTPQRIEFWYEGTHRLHDRYVYVRDQNAWQLLRLQP